MECTANIKFATYNLHGLNQGLSFLEHLCGTRDIIYVQEHWLAPFSLTQILCAPIFSVLQFQL